MPERMILCHSFPPKGQGKVRSDLLGLAKVLGRIIVFKVVELSQTLEKIRLRRRRPRIHKRNLTVGLLAQHGCRVQKPERGKKQDSRNSFHWHNPFGKRSRKRGSLNCSQLFVIGSLWLITKARRVYTHSSDGKTLESRKLVVLQRQTSTSCRSCITLDVGR